MSGSFNTAERLYLEMGENEFVKLFIKKDQQRISCLCLIT